MICNKIIYNKNCNTIVQDEIYDDNNGYIYILQLNLSNGEKITQQFIRESSDEDIIFTINQDGYYTLCKVIITKDNTSSYYYKDGNIYHNNVIIPIEDFIEINTEITGAEITYYKYFQLCNLRKCFVKLSKEILDERNSNCLPTKDATKIYKRDLIWSAINSIIYSVEMEEFEDAQTLLERITSCNGLCNNDCDCGCVL